MCLDNFDEVYNYHKKHDFSFNGDIYYDDDGGGGDNNDSSGLEGLHDYSMTKVRLPPCSSTSIRPSSIACWMSLLLHLGTRSPDSMFIRSESSWVPEG